MTGEGLRRLVKAARRIALDQDFVAAISKTRKFARGPKPGRALREIGLEPQITTEKPTSEGMIEILSRVDLSDKRVGVQLYPDKDHGALLGAIATQGAVAIPVTPYVYDARAADSHIVTAIEEMAAGRIDAIALTNLGQIRRLIDVARGRGLEARAARGTDGNADRLGRTCRVRRARFPRPVCGKLPRQRCLLHEAADLGNGDGVGKNPPRRSRN